MGDHERDEIERLDPEPDAPFKLETGLEIRVVPMRTRQVFRFLRILTHGAGGAVLAGGLDFNDKPEEFAQKLLAIATLAIPDAEQETMEFLASMCEPAGLRKPRAGEKLGDEADRANQELWDRLNTDLFNPDPLDAIDIIERIILNEATDLQALGKRLGRMMDVFRKTGQFGMKPKEEDEKPVESLPSPQVLSEQTPASSAPSPESSTPSAPSTDGPTSTSSISPSAAFVPSEPPSLPVGSPEPVSAAASPSGG